METAVAHAEARAPLTGQLATLAVTLTDSGLVHAILRARPS